MISIEELLKEAQFEDQTPEIQVNLKILLERINKIRTWWGKPMVVTSGLRTMAEHLRIYSQKGITDTSRIPMRSCHLIGAAVDIYDPCLDMTKWLKSNPSELEMAKLWCEDNNSNWCHFQIFPPNSGKRWFVA